jgi:hypothetical protein
MNDALMARLRELTRALAARVALPEAGEAAAKYPWVAQLLKSPHLIRGRWVWLISWPGIAGAALIAAWIAFYVSVIEPAQLRLAEDEQNAVSIQERVKRAAGGIGLDERPPAEQLAEFYRIFPNDKNLLPWLEKIFVLAEQQGIHLNQGEYKVKRERIGRLMRFQVTLPVKTGYPQIRRYLSSLRAEIPIIAMEHLQFERQKVNDRDVDAKLMLALYLEAAQ